MLAARVGISTTNSPRSNSRVNVVTEAKLPMAEYCRAGFRVGSAWQKANESKATIRNQQLSVFNRLLISETPKL